VFLNQSRTEVIETSRAVSRLVENADIKLYKHFFAKNWITPELLAALSRCYLEMDSPPEESLDAFRRAAAAEELSKSFRLAVRAAAGNFYAANGQFSLALPYYADAIDGELPDRFVETALISRLEAGEFDRAAELIAKRSECVPDRTLFYAAKKLKDKNVDCGLIAGVSYELIMKSWYDKELAEIVLSNYVGGHSEWLELSSALTRIGAGDRALDEKILKNAILTHIFDKGTLEAFCRVYEQGGETPVVFAFSAYCAFQVIIGDQKPESATVEALEKLFYSENRRPPFDRLLIAFALCRLYLLRGVRTPKSDDITRESADLCRTAGIIPPVMKQVKDKTLSNAYIMKNQPFAYRGFPGSRVWLRYKADDGVFREKEAPRFWFGLYLVHIPHFCGERLVYSFREEARSGSVVTPESSMENGLSDLSESGGGRAFAAINNALVYEKQSRFDKAEEIIENLVSARRIKIALM
jgi:tetratricopeptide (TPR) repeat protein